MAKILQVKSKTTDFENGRVSLELKETRFVTKSKLLASVPGQTLENVAVGQKVGEELVKDINDKQFALKRRCDTLSDRYNTLLRKNNKTLFSFTFRYLTSVYFNKFKVGKTIDVGMMKEIVRAEKELEDYKYSINSSYMVYLNSIRGNKSVADVFAISSTPDVELGDTFYSDEWHIMYSGQIIPTGLPNPSYSEVYAYISSSVNVSNNINNIRASFDKTYGTISIENNDVTSNFIKYNWNKRKSVIGKTVVNFSLSIRRNNTGEVRNVSGSIIVNFLEAGGDGLVRKVVASQDSMNGCRFYSGLVSVNMRVLRTTLFDNLNPTLPWLKSLELL